MPPRAEGERLRKQPKKEVGKLAEAMVVKRQLEEINNGVEAIPGYGGMDLAFVNASGDLMGINLFGDSEVVGVVTESSQEALDLRLKRMGKTDDMDDLLAQGARVAGLTDEDLGKWLNYYRQAAGYLPVLGRSAWEQSGLRRYKREEVFRTSELVRALLGDTKEGRDNKENQENRQYLRSGGAVGLQLVKGSEKEYFFKDKAENPVTVRLRNVRIPATSGCMLGELVESELEVVGMALPKQGETKIDLYRRAYRLGKEFGKKLGREVAFAAATAGQIKLWQGWGLRPEVKKPGLVSEDDLLRLLILGDNNLSPGLLRRSDSIGDGQWTLLDRTVMPEVITIVGKMTRDGRQIRRLPEVQVFDPRARRKGEFATVPLKGAVAIMRVAEEMDFEEMKARAKQIEDRFSHIMNSVGRDVRPRLIFLTPSLFEHWRRGGFWATDEQVNWMDTSRKREYGFGDAKKIEGGKQGIFYSGAYSGPKIGGSFRGLLQRSKENDTLVLLDTSIQFGKDKKPDYRRYADALVTAISEGEVPMWPHILEPEALLYSTEIIDQRVERLGAKDPLVVYLATEIVANLPEEAVKEVLGEKIGQMVWQIGSEHLGLFGDSKTEVVYPVSHIHVDHIKLTQNLRAEIPLLMSLASRVMARARDDLNPVSAEVLTHPQWYYGRRGSAMPRLERNVVIMKDGEEFTKDGVRIRLGSVEHSTIGAVARRIEFPDGLVVVDTGDFRRWGRSISAGSKTEKTVEQWTKEEVNCLILETTSIREGANLNVRRGWEERLKKAPVITDEPLSEGIAEVLKTPENAGKTVVVFSSPYDLGRNIAILEAVAKSGREAVLGVRHAMIASRWATEQRLLGPQAKAYVDFDYQIPPYGLYLTEGSKKYSAVTALKAELEARGTPIYDRKNILKEDGGRVLLLNPFGSEISSLDNLPLKDDLEVVWSSSIMYSIPDLNNFIKNKAHYFLKYTDGIYAEPNFWAGRLPFKLKHPGKGILHRSGHSSPLEILWYLSYFRGKKLKILLHHTEVYKEAVEFIRGAFSKEDWEVVGSLAHYRQSLMPSSETRWTGPLLRLDK